MAARPGALLPWIIAFKAVKASALATLGLVLFSARQTDPADLVVRLALSLHLPLTSRLFRRAMIFAADLTVSRETALAITALGYAILMATEGIGLYLRRSWARWFTIVATSSLVPIELYEVVREPHILRTTILLLNIAVVLYLFKRKEVFA